MILHLSRLLPLNGSNFGLFESLFSGSHGMTAENNIWSNRYIIIKKIFDRIAVMLHNNSALKDNSFFKC